MFSLFLVQLGESWLAETEVISHDFAAAARVGVGMMFLLAAVWVLRHDFRTFGRVLKDGFVAGWSDLEAHDDV